MRIRIGDLLVKAGVITELQLKAALSEQQQWGGKLGDILVRMEFLTEEVLVRALSKQTGIARADLTGKPDIGALAVVPADTAEEFGLVPIEPQDHSRPSAVEVLRGVEETQRRSVAALKAMVELLIEKGVFSRDEYLARVKR